MYSSPWQTVRSMRDVNQRRRLFDGVSAILGIRRKSTFEGEASMALEFVAEEYQKNSLKKCEKDAGDTDL